MKHISLLLSLVILCALALIPSAEAAVGLSVSPANITNDYVGKVTLTITGLSAGQTVLVDRFTDANGNGVMDAATARMLRSITKPGRQLPINSAATKPNATG